MRRCGSDPSSSPRSEGSNSRHDLWLKGAGADWALELTRAESTSERPVAVGQVLLVRKAAAKSPHLTLALVPELGSTGRLLVRWGEFAAASDVVVTAPPRSQRATDTSRPNTTVNRSHNEDTSALSRTRLLAQRNETAMVLASGERLSVSFQRSFAQGERAAGGGTPRTRGLPADGPDFARLAATPDGAIVMLTEASVPRLRIERPLQFGATLIAVSNQVADLSGLLRAVAEARGRRLAAGVQPRARRVGLAARSQVRRRRGSVTALRRTCPFSAVRDGFGTARRRPRPTAHRLGPARVDRRLQRRPHTLTHTNVTSGFSRTSTCRLTSVRL